MIQDRITISEEIAAGTLVLSDNWNYYILCSDTDERDSNWYVESILTWILVSITDEGIMVVEQSEWEAEIVWLDINYNW